jgi:hypothetical protein
MRQKRVERRKNLRILWDGIKKPFLLMFFIGLLFVVILPWTRYNPMFYLIVFFITFGISFFIFMRSKEIPPEFKGDK